MDGFNKRQAEFNASPGERRAAASNASGKEFQGVEESSVPAKKKRSRAANGVRTFLFGLTAAAVVTAAAVLPANAAEAQIVDLGATDTVISYTVDVKEVSGPLKLVLYNDFSRREAELFAGENSGKFADLQPDMRYTVAIESGTAFGGIALEKREVSTLSPEEVPVTELVSVSHECTCDVDGLFHFEVEFTDENGWWSAFEATLTDADGNVARCIFTEDAHEAQTIDVVGNDLVGNMAEFSISCLSTENVEGGVRVVLYKETVKI